MKTVVSISLGSSREDYDVGARALGHEFRVRRYGADGNLERVRDLVRWLRGDADAIGLDLGNGVDVSAVDRIVMMAREVPVTTGEQLRAVADEWALRRVHRDRRELLTNARTVFLSGSADRVSARTLAEVTRNLSFADPIVEDGVPKLLGSLGALDLWTRGVGRVRRWAPSGTLRRPEVLADWCRYVLRKALQRAHVVVGPLRQVEEHGLEELAGKVVVTSAVTPEALERLRDRGVEVVIDRVPPLADCAVGPDVLEAMVVIASGTDPDELSADDLLRVLERRDLAPRVLFPSGRSRRLSRFAFLIHPLSASHLRHERSIDLASRVLPKRLDGALERLVAFSPPFVYSRVTGIRSPTGAEAEGWLITLGGTPKQLMAHDPEFTYRRAVAAARMAERLGAQIMGLGAFTKVVGDAGVTVAKRAPLPITTGNSYSASGALWAAQDAAKRLGLLSVDADGKVLGRAMVVGATGAIGSVCARLLAMAFAQVHLVSPEVAKLIALKESILRETPQARVTITSRAGSALREMDLIVTTTSGAGVKVLDVREVKPGAIITDVARPLDLSPEEVASRPDVLVIESGEILLPGEVRMKSIGLPANVAYACLAETIVLALEGRFECFTVGRNIEWAKVKEIYKLGLKHGMRLAAISGVNGVYTDEDIRRVRERALVERERLGVARPQPAAADQPVERTSARAERRPSLEEERAGAR